MSYFGGLIWLSATTALAINPKRYIKSNLIIILAFVEKICVYVNVGQLLVFRIIVQLNYILQLHSTKKDMRFSICWMWNCHIALQFCEKCILKKCMRKKWSRHQAIVSWSWCFWRKKGRNGDSGFIYLSQESSSMENFTVWSRSWSFRAYFRMSVWALAGRVGTTFVEVEKCVQRERDWPGTASSHVLEVK